ncbi:putative DMBT1-like protein [Varanus komodoensis]|nr:putative DMBT1-like protein [Varanus komodoensis]
MLQHFNIMYQVNGAIHMHMPGLLELSALPDSPSAFCLVNQCGGNLTLPYGDISGPYYLGNNVSIQCIWKIQGNALSHIVLHFTSISLDCEKEYIKIFDGNVYSSNLLGRTCSNIYLNYSYTSSSNIMTILLNRDSNDVGNGFHAYYYSIRQEKQNEDSIWTKRGSSCTLMFAKESLFWLGFQVRVVSTKCLKTTKMPQRDTILL